MHDTVRYIFFATVLLAQAVAPTIVSAEARYVPPASQPTGHVSDLGHVEIYGEITRSDIERVSKLVKLAQLSDPSHRTVPVFLNSQGGDLPAAMEIGRSLRKFNAWAIVSNNMECSSACIFVLASGVDRNMFNGAKLGLHRPRFDRKMFANLNASEAQSLYKTLIDQCRAYFREMGISERLLEDMLKTESHKVTYQDRDYAESVFLVGRDPAFHEWNRAKRIEEEGEDVVQAKEDRVACYNAGTPQEVCDRRFRDQMQRLRNKP